MTELTVHLTVKLKPFGIPNYVLSDQNEGLIQHGQSFPLHEVSAESLALMCDQWRAGVFAKAGKSDPKEPGHD